jgi:hypothetical protein
MNHLPRIIIVFLLPFSIFFRLKKSFLKMVLLFIGAVLCHGGRTVCGCLRAVGMQGEKAFANYHHLLSRSKISMLQGSKELIKMILPLTGVSVVFVIDEHLERRRGNKIKAKATYRDPVASSKSRIIRATGLKWMVLAILVSFSWSKRSFALPICCVLRKPENHPKNLKRKTRSGTDLICQMLIVIRRWFPHLKITLLGDGDFARAKLCSLCQKLSIGLVSRMRADARLHDFVLPGKRKGRTPKVGKRLKKAEKSVWEKLQVQWYKGEFKEVLATARSCLWLAGRESAVITLKAVWVQLRPEDEVILMTTDIEMDVATVISLYVKRWNIEVTFREGRDYLGIETQREWSDLAIERSTPLLFMLYTLIVLIGNELNKTKAIVAESTAWYNKKHLTFSDLLQAVKKEMGEVKAPILNSLLNTELGKIDPGEELPGKCPTAMGF